MTPTSDHLSSQRAIAAHFAGTVAPAQESAMRAHLPTCAPCRRRYQRFLLSARLQRHPLPAEERIARGLGLPRRRRFAPLLLPALAAAAAGLLLAVGTPSPRSEPLAARGAPPLPQLWVYRVQPPDQPRLAADTLDAGDELAFAYANPGSRAHLLVFGVDEHRHIYWYHPAWPEGGPAPEPRRAAAGVGPHELPDGVRHRLDGRHLEIGVLLSDRPVTILEVERALASGEEPGTLARRLGGEIARRRFSVKP
jgi:hypothetical protein